MPLPRGVTLVGGALLTVAVTFFGLQQYSQLVRAAARAQERIATLERELRRQTVRAEQAQVEARALSDRLSRGQPACDASAASLAPAAVRASVRDALRHLSEDGPRDEAAGAGGLLADHAELVRVELAEGLHLEDSGWCRCPALPDLPRLCRAVATLGRAQEGGGAAGGRRGEATRGPTERACDSEAARLRTALARSKLALLACDEDLESAERQLETLQQRSAR